MKIKNIRGDFKKRSLKLSESLFSDEIKFSLGKKRYSMSKDVVFVAVGDASTKNSTGKNVGRLALASMAGGAASNSNLATSALFGTLAATINTSKTHISVYVYLRNGKHFIGEITETDLKAVALIVTIVLADEIGRRVEKFQSMERFLADAPRTILEVNSIIKSLEQKQLTLQHRAEDGDSFSSREGAKAELDKANAQLNGRYNLQKKLLHRIKEIETGVLVTKAETKNNLSLKRFFIGIFKWSVISVAVFAVLTFIIAIFSSAT